MKRFLWLALVVVLISGSASADTIIGLFPNDGSGDNFGFIVSGPGFLVVGSGGVPFDFFNIFGYAPGSTLGGSTQIFFSDGFVQIGSIGQEVAFDSGTLFLSSITLPTNGKDFNAWVEVDFFASGTTIDTLEPVDASGGARGHILFSYSNGMYFPSEFVEAPEAGTLGLFATGLIGVAMLARTRFRHRA